MKEIYNLKEEVLKLYRDIGLPLVMATRIIIALIAIVLINLNIGAFEPLKGILVVFGTAIIAGVLPISLGTVILMCFTIGHVFAVSYIVAAIIAVILTVLFIFGKLFSPRETYLFVAAFVLCLMGGTFAVPLVLAMLGTTLGVVPVLGGVAWFSMITVVSDMKNLLSEGGITDTVFTVLDGLMSDATILLTLSAVGVSYVITVVMKNTSINESWKSGILTGAVANVLIMMVGSMFTSASTPFVPLLVGTGTGCVLGLIVEIFVHNVDYRCVENLRFEDDEYCYFVKAIPKKDLPRELEVVEPTKAELREKAREQARAQKKKAGQRKAQGDLINSTKLRSGAGVVNNKRSKKETPQEKRARERAVSRNQV